jgi:hypothetical protein
MSTSVEFRLFVREGGGLGGEVQRSAEVSSQPDQDLSDEQFCTSN